ERAGRLRAPRTERIPLRFRLAIPGEPCFVEDLSAVTVRHLDEFVDAFARVPRERDRRAALDAWAGYIDRKPVRRVAPEIQDFDGDGVAFAGYGDVDGVLADARAVE